MIALGFSCIHKMRSSWSPWTVSATFSAREVRASRMYSYFVTKTLNRGTASFGSFIRDTRYFVMAVIVSESAMLRDNGWKGRDWD